MSELYLVNLDIAEELVFECTTPNKPIEVGYPEARLVIGHAGEDIALFTGGLVTCHTLSMAAINRDTESAALFLGHAISQPRITRGLINAARHAADTLSSQGFSIEHVGLLAPTRMTCQLYGEPEAIAIAKYESKQLAKEYDATYDRQRYSRVRRNPGTWFTTVGFDAATGSFMSTNDRQYPRSRGITG